VTGRALAERHVARFNDAVRTGEWETFLGGFAADAEMQFAHATFRGRDEIGAAYRAQPPDDEIAPLGIQENDDHTVVVAFAWSRGGTGRLFLEHDRGLVTRSRVVFDEG
jgi:hypothetical protein